VGYTAGTVSTGHGDDYFWFATVWWGEVARVARVNVVDLRSDRIVLADQYTKFGPVSHARSGRVGAPIPSSAPITSTCRIAAIV